MRIGLLTAHPSRSWHVDDLVRAARELDVEALPIDYRALAAAVGGGEESIRGADVELDRLDAVLVRAMPRGSLEQVVFRMDALHRLTEGGVRVVNPPRAIECAVDKYLALARVAAAGLAVPATRVAERSTEALVDFAELGGDVVVKPIFGAEGRGLVRVSDPELAARTFRAIEHVGAVIYQQVFIAHGGQDLRALVIGGRVVAAMRRSVPEGAPPGAWRTNVSQGGRAEPHELSAGEAALAVAAARAVGTEIAGVDLVRVGDGTEPLVLEVNSAPGWRALARASGVDVARAVLEHLLTPPPRAAEITSPSS